MFDPVILIVIDITSEILFNNLVESFYLSIDLKIKKTVESLLFISNFIINIIKNRKTKVVFLFVINSSNNL